MKKSILLAVLPLLSPVTLLARSGKVDIHFDHVYAVYAVGEPDFNAANNSYCRKTISPQYLKKPLSLSYTIQSKSSYQTSNINYLNTQVRLYPEGLTDRYAFMSDDIGALKQNKIFRVIATFDKAFQVASSFVLFETDHGFYCVMIGVGPV